MSAATAVGRGTQPPNGMPSRRNSSALDGYRGIAAISIIVFHVFQYVIEPLSSSNPFLSELYTFEIVDILFVLSAYLLTISYARAAIDGTSALPAREFLFRRAVRILPLYWIGVMVIWSLRNPTVPGDWRDLLEHLTFTQVFDQKRIFYTLGPVWSMSLEIIFYLVLVVIGPLAVRVCAGIGSRRKRVALLMTSCLTLWAVSVVWNCLAYLVFRIPYHHWPVYFGPQARFGAFAAGMLLAVVVAARRGEALVCGVWPSVLRLVAVAVIAGATWIDRADSWGQATYHDIASVGWLLLLSSTELGVKGQRWSRVMAWRPLVLLGLIGYSTYMWHEPIMQALYNHGITSRSQSALPWSIAAVLSLSVIAGIVSYRVIEVPTGKLRAMRTKSGAKRDYYPQLEPADVARGPISHETQPNDTRSARPTADDIGTTRTST